MAQNRALQFTVFYPSDVDGTQGGSLPRMDPDIIQSWNPGKFGKQFGEFYAAIFQGGGGGKPTEVHFSCANPPGDEKAMKNCP